MVETRVAEFVRISLSSGAELEFGVRPAAVAWCGYGRLGYCDRQANQVANCAVNKQASATDAPKQTPPAVTYTTLVRSYSPATSGCLYEPPASGILPLNVAPDALLTPSSLISVMVSAFLTTL